MKNYLIVLMVMCQVGFSQNRSCGKDAQMQKIMNNPVSKQKYLALQKRFKVELDRIENSSNRLASPNNTIYIPIAVHFPAVSATSTDKVCLRALAQNQIDILNADYNAVNTDISLWTPTVSAFYPGTNIGSINVQFVIATTNHPAGTGLTNGDKAVTFGTNFLNDADDDSQWAGYMNIVCRDADGSLGYSPLGGNLSIGETVVINFESFGSGSGCGIYVPDAPYNLGRTLTHELGHFFNLDHTFEGCSTASNCLTTGDLICDTPASNAAVGGCPTAGSVTKCNVKTLTMNYMDYTNDACMYMFTAGQANRMLAYYNTISSQFVSNVLSSSAFLENSFSVFPNPNNGEFNITLKNVLANYAIEVYDSLGRNVFEQEYLANQNMANTISLRGKPNGLYFVSIKTDDSVWTKKIIVQ